MNVVQHGAVQLQDIGPAVIVIVQELHGDAAQQDGLVPYPGAIGAVIDGSIPVVVVKSIQFEIKVRDVHSLPAVAVHVRGIDAHSRLIASVLAGRPTGNGRYIPKGRVMPSAETQSRATGGGGW